MMSFSEFKNKAKEIAVGMKTKIDESVDSVENKAQEAKNRAEGSGPASDPDSAESVED